MGVSFGIFAREHILTWNHLWNPYSFAVNDKVLKLKPEVKATVIFYTLISAGVAAGASLVLNRSRITILVIAGSAALATFYAITGYIKWGP
jgi:hypothetical protein